MAVIGRNGETGYCLGLWLSGLCTGIPVTDPEFDPGHESVLSLSACVS